MIALLFLLCVYSGEAAHSHFPYPTVRDLAESKALYVGSEVLVRGVVTDRDEGGVWLSTSAGAIRVREVQASIGDLVEVLGTLEENDSLTPREVVVYPRTDFYAMFARSLVGAALLVLLFFRSWKPRGWRMVEG